MRERKTPEHPKPSKTLLITMKAKLWKDEREKMSDCRISRVRIAIEIINKPRYRTIFSLNIRPGPVTDEMRQKNLNYVIEYE